jgi:uncharacterized membrane protein YhdT
MTGSIIKVIIGLFIWMVLPSLLKKSTKNKSLFKFIKLACLLLGILIIIYGIFDLGNIEY